MHFYYAFLAIDFAFGIHGLVPGQQLITVALIVSVFLSIEGGSMLSFDASNEEA